MMCPDCGAEEMYSDVIDGDENHQYPVWICPECNGTIRRTVPKGEGA